MRILMMMAALTVTAFLFGCAALLAPPEKEFKMQFVQDHNIAKAIRNTGERETLYETGSRRGVSVQGQQVRVDLKGLNVNDLIDMVFGELLQYPYIVEQEIRSMNKSVDVSIKRKMPKKDLYGVAVKALEKLGFHVEDQDGVLFVFAKDEKVEKKRRSVVHVRMVNVSAPDVLKALTAHLGKDEDIRVSDDGKRSIVISGESEPVGRLARIAKAFDQAQKRVLAQIQIYELTMTGDFKYGLEAFIRATLGRAFAGIAIESQNINTGYRAAVSVSGDLNIALDLLEKRGVVRIISKPSFLCHDGKASIFNVGQEIPIIQGEKTTLQSDQVYQAVEYKKTGINITLTPVVLSASELVLDMNIEISKGETTTTSTINSPTIIRRAFKSSIKMLSGNTVMIAGLIQAESDQSLSTVPGLGEWSSFVGSNSKSHAATELVILLTPKILESDDDAVPDDFIDKINALKKSQNRG